MTTLIAIVGSVALFVLFGLFFGRANEGRDCQGCADGENDLADAVCPLLEDPAAQLGPCDRTGAPESTPDRSDGVPLPVLRVTLQ
jgi:hypothetical protein